MSEINIAELITTADQLLAKPKLPLRWLFRNLIYRDLICLMDGLGGAGKSKVALQICMNILAQKSFLDIDVFPFCNSMEQPHILYLTTEDPQEIIQDRMESIAKAFEKLFVLNQPVLLY